MRTIFLFGQSLLLSLVTASLNQNADLHIVQASAWGELESLAAGSIPDVLIYDLAGAAENRILPMLYDHPRLQLIGLDVETNRAVLLSGRETRALTLDGVKDLVEARE
jgi:hypothetical protein